MVFRGRWARPDESAGLQAHRSGDVQNCPVVRLDSALRRVIGRLSRRAEDEKEQSSPVCSTQGIRAICPASEARRTAGCERDLVPTQVATRLQEGTRFCAANTVRLDAGKTASVSMRVQAVRCARSRDCGAVRLLSTQIVRKTGESNFISNDAVHCVQSRRQRFPTVRMVGLLGNGEVRAKMRNIRACTSTVL